MTELVVNLDAIVQNTRTVASLLRNRGLVLIGVTKAAVGEPMVGRAMLDGGAEALADTRDANLARLRRVFPGVDIHRIHLPPVGRSFVAGDVTYVSTQEAVAVLAERGGSGSPARVVIAVESGDAREGAPPGEVPELAERIAADERLALEGVATNYACFAGPAEGLPASVEAVADAARGLEEAGHPVGRVSAGNSAVLDLLLEGGSLPAEATELRCGEALLFGHETRRYRPLPGAAGPACVVRARVVERYTKASGPEGMPRVVLDVGSQDLGQAPVGFARPGVTETGRSSDYMVVSEGPGAEERLRPGGIVEMIPSYYALVAAWTSPFVEVRFE